MKGRIFFDMDGVLAKWDQNGNPHTPGYFKYRELEPCGPHIIFWLQRCGLDVYILSKAYKPPSTAMADKMEWCQKNLPMIPKDHILLVPYGEEKSLYVPGGVEESDILVDDYSENLRSWPGKAIKALNGINNTKGTWLNAGGEAIDLHDEFYMSVSILLDLAGVCV